MASHAAQPTDDPAYLDALRTAAAALLTPWPDGQRADELSTARRKAVSLAAQELVRLTTSGVRRDSPAKERSDGASARNDIRAEHDLARMGPGLERQVGVSLEELSALFILDALSGFGPQKFKQLFEAGMSPLDAVSAPRRLPLGGRTGEQLREALHRVTRSDRIVARQRAARQLVAAADNEAHILTYTHPLYPRNVLDSNNAIPVLYAAGDLRVLQERHVIACVGSREIREPYQELQYQFAHRAAQHGVVIASGFALGADTFAHLGAIDAHGATVAVMPSGLDRPFPPENKNLFQRLRGQPGALFVSEFPFGTGASAMTLRKRNKLIVSFSRSVLIGQSSYKGGAMNAFRFALEQRKPIATFQPDGTSDTTGNDLIAHEQKVPTIAFHLHDGPEEWNAWLTRTLTSS